MGIFLSAAAEAALIALSMSADSFAVGLAYGVKGIKIPFKSVQIINLTGLLLTGAALLLGAFFAPRIPQGITAALAFTILFIMGSLKLADSAAKAFIRKHSDLNREIKGSLFNFKFILTLYADPEKADADGSKSLSALEAASLALSLSMDGIIIGFGAALINANIAAVLAMSFVINTFLLTAGLLTGEKAICKNGSDLSWISGAVLIVLAFLKLL